MCVVGSSLSRCCVPQTSETGVRARRLLRLDVASRPSVGVCVFEPAYPAW